MGASGSTPLDLQLHVSKLSEPISVTDKFYWRQLWEVPDTAEQIWTYLSLAKLRKIKTNVPYNLAALFTNVVTHIRSLVCNDKVLYPKESKELLNCVRILTRLLSVVLEDPNDALEREFLWHGRLPRKQVANQQAALSAAPAAAAASGAGDALPGSEPEPVMEELELTELQPVGEGPEGDIACLPLAHQIVHLLTMMLFLPDFTVPGGLSTYRDRSVDEVRIDLIWAKGAGVPEEEEVDHNDITDYDSNRVEVIRALIVAFSGGIFVPTEHYRHGTNAWLNIMTSPDHDLAPTLCYSLINIVTRFDPVGKSFASRILPYASAMSEDPREPLVNAALHLLLLLLDHRLPEDQQQVARQEIMEADARAARAQAAAAAAAGEEKVDVPAPDPEEMVQPETNIFRYLTFTMDDRTVLSGVYAGIARLLNNNPQAANTYFPGSMKKVICNPEVFVLLWMLLDENYSFFDHVLTEEDVLHVARPLFWFLLDSRVDPSKAGLMYTCVFILLRLSGEREFSVQLNKQYAGDLPFDHRRHGIGKFTGTHADLLIVAAHKLIVGNPDQVDALLSVLLTVLANVSPYITSLTLPAARRLLSLFQLFSSTKFLCANPTNNQYVFLLLDVFNNMIQYQFAGNAPLVYAITRRARAFTQLGFIPKPQDWLKRLRAGSLLGNEAEQEAVVEEKDDVAEGEDEAAAGEGTPSVEELANGNHVEQDSKQEHDESAAAAAAAAASNVPEMSPNSRHRVPSSVLTEEQEISRAMAEAARLPFVPTYRWLVEWKSKLPLDPIFRLLEFFLPQIDKLCREKEVVTETNLVDLIAESTLVGVLPAPHPIIVRRYVQNTHTNNWFTTYLWGVIFLNHQKLPLFDGRKIRMFAINNVNTN